jgi:hypothetical protein
MGVIRALLEVGDEAGLAALQVLFEPRNVAIL